MCPVDQLLELVDRIDGSGQPLPRGVEGSRRGDDHDVAIDAVCVGAHALRSAGVGAGGQVGTDPCAGALLGHPEHRADLGVRRSGCDRRGRRRPLVEPRFPQQCGPGQLDVLGLGRVATLDGPHQPARTAGLTLRRAMRRSQMSTAASRDESAILAAKLSASRCATA